MLKRLVPVVAVAAIGAAGLALTQQSEGLRLTAYRDPVSIPTICYGHTGPDVHMGMTLTKQQCDNLLWLDIQKHQPVILAGRKENCINNAPLTANERDALTDFIINVGTAKFCGSTMASRLRARDYIGAADQFPKWTLAGGHRLPGLVKRRGKERDLFVTYQRADARDVLSAPAVALLATPLQ